jgi:hypothetical protein
MILRVNRRIGSADVGSWRVDRSQRFSQRRGDYVAEDNLVRAIDAFVEGLDLGKLGGGGLSRWKEGGPAIFRRCQRYIYGYLNRVPSSRRLERECQLQHRADLVDGASGTGLQTIAQFRKDNCKAIRGLPRLRGTGRGGLLSEASVAVDGSKSRL